jgi:hypothetical protein
MSPFALPAAAGGLFRNKVAVAGRGFRILVNGDDDRLDLLIAPAFSRRETTNLFGALRKGVGFVSSSNHLTRYDLSALWAAAA